MASACDDRDQYAHAHDSLGRTYLATGNPDTAREHWAQALTVYEQIGAPEAEHVRSSLAELVGPRP